MQYVGKELDLFQDAHAWKRYYSRLLREHARGAVLEVGGGIGGTTPYLVSPAVATYTVLEPDPDLTEQLVEQQQTWSFGEHVAVINGTLAALPSESVFDAIYYIDVLEHIQEDAAELAAAATHLRAGGVLCVLSPAFNSLWSPFDEAVGHCRRYTIDSLRRVFPGHLEIVSARYFDAVGACLSLANRLLLRASQPTRSQINFWNRYILPISRVVDPLCKHGWGRSVLMIGRA